MLGKAIKDVAKSYENRSIFVRLVAGGAILDNQLSGLTVRTVEYGKAVFSGLAVPALTGKEFRLQFVLQDATAGMYLTVSTGEFAVRPSALLLNNTLPHSRSGMIVPVVSVRLANRTGVFVPQEPLSHPQKAVEISVDLLTTRYLGCSRLRPSTMALANWSECARTSALAGASFFFVGPDARGQSICGFGGTWSQGCLNDTCWNDMPVTTSECSTVGCARVEEQEQGTVCNLSYGFRFFALQNASSLLLGTRRSFAVGGQTVFNDIRIPHFYGRTSCMLLFSDDGNTPGNASSVCVFCLCILFVSSVCVFCLCLLFVSSDCVFCLCLLFAARAPRTHTSFSPSPNLRVE